MSWCLSCNALCVGDVWIFVDDDDEDQCKLRVFIWNVGVLQIFFLLLGTRKYFIIIFRSYVMRAIKTLKWTFLKNV